MLLLSKRLKKKKTTKTKVEIPLKRSSLEDVWVLM